MLLSILWGFSHLSVGDEVAFTVGDERLQFFSTDGSRIAREVLLSAGVNTWLWPLATSA